jgi:mannonate dehydratase
VHLDVSSINFGIQEWSGFNNAIQEVFPGCPEVRNGYVYPSNKPGLGIDVDEQLAAKFPCDNALPTWTNARLPDGTPVTP